MAHIANKIDAKDKKLSEVLSGQRYRIDSFQREYRWQRKQIEALISDLVTSFKKNYKASHSVRDASAYDCYYMGPIVLCDTSNELSIVDGQQRLSSFTLLLVYLLHAQDKIISDTVLRDLKPFLYVTKAGERTFVLNVRTRNRVLEHLISNPDEVFSEVEELENDAELQADEPVGSSSDESINNLIGRYEDITKLFPDDIREKTVLPVFVEWLLEKVVIVEVRAYSMENAYTIFETMNDRGMTLNPTEILKAFLLHKIADEVKSDEVNKFWKQRIAEIKATIGDETELDFFRSWLRAKYAETKREKKLGSENEDFELIGTQFHSWVKNNPEKVNLFDSNDYYFFIRSDFDFFSNLYRRIYELRNINEEGFENLYCSHFYPIAESLFYPLLISPISKLDEILVVDAKIKLTGKFVDVYTLSRVMMGRAITQSTIRGPIYELVKVIRNLSVDALKVRLLTEINQLLENMDSPFTTLHRMDNWGFYHYLLARMLYLQDKSLDFESLQRSKKQNSLILYRIFELEEKPEEVDEYLWTQHIGSVAGHCLVRRNDMDTITSKRGIKRLQYLTRQGYLPEMEGIEITEITDFISSRDQRLRENIDKLISF